MYRRIAILVAAQLALVTPARADIITFEDIALAGPNTFLNGSTPPGGPFVSGGASFNNFYNSSFDFWSGWSISNVKNTTLGDYTNQYAAYAPNGGDKSSQYAVANAYSQGDATIALPSGQMPVSISLANTTYTALVMKNGNQFTNGPFGGGSHREGTRALPHPNANPHDHQERNRGEPDRSLSAADGVAATAQGAVLRSRDAAA